VLDQFTPIDGFTLRRDLRCNFAMLSLALSQFDELRRVGNFRQRQWTFPTDPFTSPIPAFDSSEKELRVGIGAVIWGYQVCSVEQRAPLISGFQIRDNCSDLPLFEEPNYVPQGVWPGTGGDLADSVGYGPVVLPRLLVIGKPGIITIEVMTRNNAAVADQVILYGGQPVGVTK
jgi:hypothetical protein